MSNAFPALTHLAQAYLHQDFVAVSGSAAGAVDEFVLGEPRLAPMAAEEAERALATHPSEPEARTFVLDVLDSSYLVEVDGLTYRGWLQSVADRARELGS